MGAVGSVLVVGAGAAGCTVAILLARAGVAVELVEVAPAVPERGSGISLQGNALRVLRELGVWEQARANGYSFDSVGLRAPDAAGTLVHEFTDARLGGDDLPATLGMHRPRLARLLVDRAVASGVSLRFSTTVRALQQDGEGVAVRFADDSEGRYDLVIGADGVRSQVRRLLGVEPGTRKLGMGIFRATTARPPAVTRTDLYYGGPSYIAGYCPTGENSLYCYLVEPAQDRSRQSGEQLLADLRVRAAAYHGPWDDLLPLLTDPASVSYTQFETHFVEGAWHRGRIVLLGDAVHVCPPTLAQGAAMAFEDGAVLAELLLEHAQPDDRLWAAFTARRLDRARAVVEASTTLAQWQVDGVRGDVAAITGPVLELLATPA